MTMETVSFSLSSDLIQKAKKLMGESGNLDAFVADAIATEIERRQMPQAHQEFWETVSQIQTDLKAEDLDLDPDEVWTEIRDPSPGREVVV